MPDMPSALSIFPGNVWTGRLLPLGRAMLLDNVDHFIFVKTVTAAGLGEAFGAKGRASKSQRVLLADFGMDVPI